VGIIYYYLGVTGLARVVIRLYLEDESENDVRVLSYYLNSLLSYITPGNSRRFEHYMP